MKPQAKAHPLRAAMLGALLILASLEAGANPSGAQVVSGAAAITSNGNTLTIHNTPGTVINWQGFSIGAGEVANFVQQSSSSAVLNRVVGQSASSIAGALLSNGRVFLTNPNGVLIAPGALIDTASFTASTSEPATNGGWSGTGSFVSADRLTSGGFDLSPTGISISGLVAPGNGVVLATAGTIAGVGNIQTSVSGTLSITSQNAIVSPTINSGNVSNTQAGFQSSTTTGSIGAGGTLTINAGSTVLLTTGTVTNPSVILVTAGTLPLGGVVTAGAATVTQPTASTITVNQTTQGAALDWQNFSLGSNLSFHQPSNSSVSLNRVVGPSRGTITGSLQSNPQVSLINPSGALFGAGASISVGGLTTGSVTRSGNMVVISSSTGSGNSASSLNAPNVASGRPLASRSVSTFTLQKREPMF